ncbi:hypothetical protein [Nostoc sp.]
MENSKKQEKQPNGLPDVNVFDIQQGVSITFGVKGVESYISHCNLYGNREIKYKHLANSDINYTQWKVINPQSPFYLLCHKLRHSLMEYEKTWKLTDIFPVNSVSIVTARDSLTIRWSKEEIWDLVTDF